VTAHPPPAPIQAGRARRRAGAPPVAATDIAEAPVSLLPGAGPATAERLAAHGLGTIGAVLAAVPRAYDDLRAYTPLDALGAQEPGAVVLVRGRVVRVHLFPRRFLAVTVEADGARVVARWFRAAASMARPYVKGAEVVLAGPLRFTDEGQPELLHPANMTARSQEAGTGGLGIRPRYAVVPGVAGRVVERLAAAAVTGYAERLPDLFGPATRARLGLPAVAEALRALHLPPAGSTAAELDALVAGKSPAHRRMALEDLLILQVGLARRRAAARAQPARACAVPQAELRAGLEAVLPFVLTRAQARAIGDVHRDLSGGAPMQRLLVGDVGSGKTVVAFAAAAQVARAGAQTLLMAPTELLAEQHARTFSAWATPLGVRVALLTASTPRRQRAALLARAAAGEVDVLVGTQALLSERLVLPGLALAIVDEQHRFGVADRARLRERRGETDALGPVPHLLVMTATPIPRTLAFTLYGDLDLSVLDELPPGRQRIATLILDGPSAREAAEDALRATVAAGRRAFVVCPVRAQARRDGAVSAVDRHRALSAALAPARVGLVHGELSAGAKEAALRGFQSGTVDVLVATTVVEVGIDVPEATLMVIEEAERFGLAQLHQLRGRVGRGTAAAACLLLLDSATAEARARLETLAATNDGFAVAEADLQQRGCGDLFGVRQAGMPRVRFADLAGTARMLDLARAEAALMLAADPELRLPAHEPLRRAVDARWAAAPVFGEEAG
jgi:ATP-dependent DNA helicase RecG